MSYLVLARKFRPADFGSVKGQEHVTVTLANAIKRNKVSHAFLFCGPRGVGKTSVARALAKGLNCVNGPTATPCLKCTNCIEISESRSLAVREIDGASHNSVDNVREVIDTLRSLPAPGSKYKIYIIDEVHMLSTAAFNALLKSLEEPPPNTIFILATTEIHKIPETVVSRCQRYDFRALNPLVVLEQLKQIVAAEKIEIDEEVLSMIARISDGSMRDAQSLLDRVQSFGSGRVTAKDASLALGVVERRLLGQLSAAIIAHDCALVLQLISEIFSSGIDPRLFLDDLVSHWRDLLVVKVSAATARKELGVSSEVFSELSAQVEPLSRIDVQDLLHIVREGADMAVRSAYPRYALEALLVRMACREPVKDIAALIASVAGPSVPKAISSTIQARVIEKQSVRPASSPKAVEVASSDKKPAASVRDLDWRAFVNHAASSAKAPMLLEYLRRLSVKQFSSGKLVGTGAKVAIEYLKDPANIEKFKTLLSSFEPCPSWDIVLQEGNGDAASVPSLAEQERNQEVIKRKQVIENAAAHPAVDNLKQFFPGSVLEDEIGRKN